MYSHLFILQTYILIWFVNVTKYPSDIYRQNRETYLEKSSYKFSNS